MLLNLSLHFLGLWCVHVSTAVKCQRIVPMSGMDNCKGLGVPGHRAGKKVTQVKIVPSCQDPTFNLQRQVLEKRSTQDYRSSLTSGKEISAQGRAVNKCRAESNPRDSAPRAGRKQESEAGRVVWPWQDWHKEGKELTMRLGHAHGAPAIPTWTSAA